MLRLDRSFHFNLSSGPIMVFPVNRMFGIVQQASGLAYAQVAYAQALVRAYSRRTLSPPHGTNSPHVGSRKIGQRFKVYWVHVDPFTQRSDQGWTRLFVSKRLHDRAFYSQFHQMLVEIHVLQEDWAYVHGTLYCYPRYYLDLPTLLDIT